MRSKFSIAESIKKTITRPRREYSDIANTVDQNFSSMVIVRSISDVLERFSVFENEALGKLTKELHFIPLSFRQLQNHQERLFNNLIKMVALLETRLEQETDPVKKKELQNTIDSLRGRGNALGTEMMQRQGLGTGATIKEGMAARLGLNPDEVSQKGLLRTLFARSRRILSGKEGRGEHDFHSNNFDSLAAKYVDIFKNNGDADKILPSESDFDIDMDESIDDQLISPERGRNGRRMRQKTRDNALESSGLLMSILEEMVLIRELIEGRTTYNPSTGKYAGDRSSQSTTDQQNYALGLLYPSKNERSRLSGMLSSTEDIDNENRDRGRVTGMMSSTEDIDNENTDRSTSVHPAASTGDALGGANSPSGATSASGLGSMFNAGMIPGASPSGPNPLAMALGGIVSAKLAGKVFRKVATSKIAAKAASKAAIETGSKFAAKSMAKAVGKGLVKKLPIVGAVLGLKFAYDRIKQGDMLGAAGEAASGLASTIPGIGTAASIGIDGALAARDVSTAMTQQKNMGDMMEGVQSGGSSATIAAPTVVNNNYATAPSSGGSDLSTIIPSIRNTETSFLRYLDKRMTRIL